LKGSVGRSSSRFAYFSSTETFVKLIFVNRFFYPDHSATSRMLSDLAFALIERGKAVCVITSRQRYDAPADTLPPREKLKGVSVYRVWTSCFGRTNLLGRTADYATFYLAAFWHLWRLARSGDVIIAKTDPPMLSLIAVPLCWLRGAELINWLQDIFPEAAQALGVGGRAAGSVYGLIRWFRNKSLRAAYSNVVVGERMAELVLELGIPGHRVRKIPNWADGATIVPSDRDVNQLRAGWGIGNAFVVGYSGNLGRAHEINTLLEAMTLLEKDAVPGGSNPADRVLWLFIGSGALFDTLKQEVARLGLTSARFKPYQPNALLAQSLTAADVHLVSLRPELEGLIVPSKFYGICAAGRPTIFVGDKYGEIALLVERHGCGRTVAMGDGASLARTVLELAADPALRCQMGERARRAFDAEYGKSMAIARWESLLLEVSAAATSGIHPGKRPVLAPRKER
jgi:glycosyltransferase involved in cell wall biosynthesis